MWPFKIDSSIRPFNEMQRQFHTWMNQGGGNQTFVIYHNAETQMLRLETVGAGKKDSDEFLTLQTVALKKGLLLALWNTMYTIAPDQVSSSAVTIFCGFLKGANVFSIVFL